MIQKSLGIIIIYNSMKSYCWHTRLSSILTLDRNMMSTYKVWAQTCIKKKEKLISILKRLREGREREGKKGSWKISIFLMMSSSIYGSQELNKESKVKDNLLKIKIKMEKLISMHLTSKFN
jgi:hypothetical protein